MKASSALILLINTIATSQMFSLRSIFLKTATSTRCLNFQRVAALTYLPNSRPIKTCSSKFKEAPLQSTTSSALDGFENMKRISEKQRDKETDERDDDANNSEEESGDDYDDDEKIYDKVNFKLGRGKKLNVDGTHFLKVKVRQHVNPLSSKYQVPIQLEEDWLAKRFKNSKLPLVLDIGCAKGSWAISVAAESPEQNVLGLEIRRPAVDIAMDKKHRTGLENVYFLASNCNIDIPRILGDINSETSISVITIQFPDPQFKKRHRKRRLVNEKFVIDMAKHLPSGTKIFLQSDILELEEDMIETFLANPAFAVVEGYDRGSLTTNKSPFSIQTEREIATLAKELPVYRLLIERC